MKEFYCVGVDTTKTTLENLQHELNEVEDTIVAYSEGIRYQDIGMLYRKQRFLKDLIEALEVIKND